MKRQAMAAVMAVMSILAAPEKAQAYDIDCAIMLCMAGGFPPSAVCARAYRTMIRRITPWPSLPPFGVCTYAAMPVALGGPGGEADLDISLPEYAWLNWTHVIWFNGRSFRDSDDDRRYSWTIKSCDHENRICRMLSAVSWSQNRWPASFRTQSGLVVEAPGDDLRGNFSVRAIMVEYGDYEANMGHLEWTAY